MPDLRGGYVHGYAERESARLADQADALVDLLHHDTAHPAGSRVLEAGCGVGAQTVTLVERSPDARFTSIDLSGPSIAVARQRVADLGVGQAVFAQADVFGLPFADATFDAVVVCFVLEHLPRPVAALASLRRVLRPGGTITVIEGDHGSAVFAPESAAARAAIDCQIRLQSASGGDACIGRRTYPLLVAAGFVDVQVAPRMVYVDASRPDLAQRVNVRTFTAMIEGVREDALTAGLIDAAAFDAGIRDLRRTTRPDGTFCYTFFKGVARKGPPNGRAGEL